VDDFRIPYQYASEEYIEKKSRFIGQIWPITSEEDVSLYRVETRDKYKEATHHVYAYILKENGIMRYSDAGEPQGTAGMPILEVLRREEIFDVLCIVTRYFGGTLLGAGGLVRAYAHTAKLALDKAGIAVMQRCVTMKMRVPYHLWGIVQKAVEGFECDIDDVSYGEDVSVIVTAPEGSDEQLKKIITDETSGCVTCETLSKEYRKRKI